MPDPLPAALVRALVDGPSPVRGVEWHDEVTSTNELAVRAAHDGAPAVHVVVADVQTAGRGRLGRAWTAPPGTSLMCSWMLRPRADTAVSLVPLAAGLALAQVADGHCPGVEVAVKWPNDLLVAGRKAAGVLVETPTPGVVVVGTGLNVDWRGVTRPPGLLDAISLSEAIAAPVDRWRVLAGLAGVLTRRLAQLSEDPGGVLAAYRARCSTIGQRVRVTTATREDPVEGVALDVDGTGGLVVQTGSGRRTLHVGDVEHVRPG